MRNTGQRVRFFTEFFPNTSPKQKSKHSHYSTSMGTLCLRCRKSRILSLTCQSTQNCRLETTDQQTEFKKTKETSALGAFTHEDLGRQKVGCSMAFLLSFFNSQHIRKAPISTTLHIPFKKVLEDKNSNQIY